MHRLGKWGNSTGLRLPASVMEAAGLEAGDYVYVRLLDTGDIRVRPVKNAQPAHPLAADGEIGTAEIAVPTAAVVTTW
ncbi:MULTISPECIES: AbrB/MazE/SpoVT family DNA-binding domain-containing protein [unclassified Variovorax]|uniref:AbrB/MazE/SpoVT family DNA-binding domain-containing protein n=1 Tax=unclassified Variovorax TaxID=663243 RepID=UPI003F46931D